MASTRLKAAATKINITPPLGSRINGDFITHFANYIHDDLFARVLALESDQNLLFFVVLDTCIIPQELSDRIKNLIAGHTNVRFENILIASTHTHAAGSLADVHLGSIDMDYARALPQKVLEAVQQALERLKPAHLGYAAVEAPDHVVCRRYFMKDGYSYLNPVTGVPDAVKTNPVGAEEFIDKRVSSPDTQLSYLAIRGENGEWISILANYSLHYVGDWENGTISADYFGVFAGYLENQLSGNGNLVAMMTNGTSGDVNIWDFLKPERYPSELFAKSRLIGEDLAQNLISSLGTVVWQENPELRSVYREVRLKVEKPTTAQVAEAEVTVAKTNYETITPDSPESIRSLYAREQLLINRFPETLTCPVQVFSIGDVIIGALAGEFFAETGLQLKAGAGKPYFTITMANGNVGYIPPKDQLLLGGYETWKCRYRCTEDDSEQIVRETLAKLVSEIQDA